MCIDLTVRKDCMRVCMYRVAMFIVYYRYKIALLKPSVKALGLSTRVSIRTDTRGFLSLQYMIKNEDGQVCFVEYFVSSYSLKLAQRWLIPYHTRKWW